MSTRKPLRTKSLPTPRLRSGEVSSGWGHTMNVGCPTGVRGGQICGKPHWIKDPNFAAAVPREVTQQWLLNILFQGAGEKYRLISKNHFQHFPHQKFAQGIDQTGDF
ncbi:MAG: hypothetical protein WA728_25205 [Xanthobacteraceae bacterium]